MKIKNGFIVREIADSIVAVPTGELVKEFNGIINLNSTSKFIWELLQNDMTVDEVAEKLVEKYHLNENRAKNMAKNFMEKLEEANIVEK